MSKKSVIPLFRTQIAILCILALSACVSQPSLSPSSQNNPSPSQSESCVLIDTDFDIDDMMAIPVVMGSFNVKAIINSEGYTLAPQGASALSRFVAEPSKPLPSIIVGASYPGVKDIKKWPWLGDMRASMERMNDFMGKPLTPYKSKNQNYTKEINQALAGCKTIKVLIIGAFTSFVEYSPAIRDRITSVIMQGRPYQSDKYEKPRLSFNCDYDIESCKKAFEQLKGLNPTWVDVPREANPPYTPTIEMINALDDTGLPGTLKKAMLSNQKHWRLGFLEKGNQSRLWDQLAALYMIHPEAFHLNAAHMEPTLPPATIQKMWTDAVNLNNR